MLQIGDKMPDFELKGVWGKIRNNYEFADKYALAIVFTCNSCPYSKKYGQRLIKLLAKYEDDNFGIIGVNSNCATLSPEDSYENMVAVADKLKLQEKNFLYIHDVNQEMAKSFGARYTPEVFLFNSKRELVYKGAIDDNAESAELVTRVYLEDAIEYCLDGIEVDFPEVPVTEGCPIIWKTGNEPDYVKQASK